MSSHSEVRRPASSSRVKIPAVASRRRKLLESESGASSPGGKSETMASNRGLSQKGDRDRVAGSLTQATVPYKLKFSSKSRRNSSSSGTRLSDKSTQSGLRNNGC